jgi:hypothetical protein
MTLFRIILTAAWLALAWVTWHAVQLLGLDKAGDTFFADMAHPWRAQFNTDFGFHLLLVAAWIVWSNANRMFGLLFGLLAILGGGMFTLAYLLVQTIRCGGNMQAVLLGRHATQTGS